jgi:hypothetical protein
LLIGCGELIKEKTRIVGGYPADPGEWPWMAALLHGQKIITAIITATFNSMIWPICLPPSSMNYSILEGQSAYVQPLCNNDAHCATIINL